MKALGLLCKLEKPHFRVIGVAMELQPDGTLAGTKIFSHLSSAQEDLPLQLKSLSLALASQLAVIRPSAVVVRAVDFSPSGRSLAALQKRSYVDGVITAVSRDACENTVLLSGKEIGEACGLSKEDAEVEAARLVDRALKEAGAAALAALRLAQRP
jgi:hypothetical protein